MMLEEIGAYDSKWNLKKKNNLKYKSKHELLFTNQF